MMQREDLPVYECVECGVKPTLMVDKTAGGATVGIGCECTIEDGRPFVMLGSNTLNLPDRWSTKTETEREE